MFAVGAIVALALLASAPMLSPAASYAHAGYDSSTPGDGEVVAESPARVDVYFGQEMARSGGLPTLVVVNESGEQVDLGATLDDDDRTHMFVDLPPELSDGRYTVIWHTVSDEDGEEAQGAFHFYVGEGPNGVPAMGTEAPNVGTVTATPEPAAAPDDDDGSGVSVWLLVVGVAGGLLIGGGAGMALGRRRGE